MLQYHGWFSNNSLKEWFHEQQTWRKHAPLFVAMNTALRAAEAAQKKREAQQDEMENGDETRPIDPEVNKSW